MRIRNRETDWNKFFFFFFSFTREQIYTQFHFWKVHIEHLFVRVPLSKLPQVRFVLKQSKKKKFNKKNLKYSKWRSRSWTYEGSLRSHYFFIFRCQTWKSAQICASFFFFFCCLLFATSSLFHLHWRAVNLCASKMLFSFSISDAIENCQSLRLCTRSEEKEERKKEKKQFSTIFIIKRLCQHEFNFSLWSPYYVIFQYLNPN